MATVRISQLTAITTPTDDDVLIINDADTNTRKITFANLTQGLLNTSSTPQTKAGALTVSGTLAASGNLVVDTNTLFVDATNNRVGIRTASPNTELDVDGTVRVRNANAIQFGDANDSNYVALRAPGVVPINYSLTLPDGAPPATNLLAVASSGAMEYTIGVTYDSINDALSAGSLYVADQGVVRFYELAANGSEYIQFRAPSTISTSTAYVLPGAYPAAAGYVLSSDTIGNLSWVSNSASAAGTGGEIQFNTGGVLNADADLTWNSGTNTVQTVNITLSGVLNAQGDVNLGDANTDSISFVGRADTDLIPIVDGSHDLGTNALKWAEAHVNNLYVYGNTSLGNNVAADTLSVNATVVTDVLPVTGAHNLGGPSNYWSKAYSLELQVGGGPIAHNGISNTTVHSDNSVASAASLDVNLGAENAYTGYKLAIVAKDLVTGDVEIYEHLIVQDGAGGISEISGNNAQAPVPGTFLTTPTTAIVAGDVVCSVANTAIAGNNVSISVQAVALSTL